MHRRRRVNPNAPKYLERRIKKNAGQLVARNTPYVSEAYKQYQNARNVRNIYRDGKRYVRAKLRRL